MIKAYVLATKHSPFKREAGDHATQNAILEVDFDLDLVACPEGNQRVIDNRSFFEIPFSRF